MCGQWDAENDWISELVSLKLSPFYERFLETQMKDGQEYSMEHIEVDDQGMCQGEINPKTKTHRSGSANWEKLVLGVNYAA